jgi:hypothetical protein
VESGNWLVVEQLFPIEAELFVVPARSAAAYRIRKAPSGAKHDRFDAWTLAAALRAEHAEWRPISRPDELTQQLRLLCRNHVTLIEEKRLEIFARAGELAGSSAVRLAKRKLVLSLIKMLRCLAQQIDAYEEVP